MPKITESDVETDEPVNEDHMAAEPTYSDGECQDSGYDED
jgi:hypothetical protein